MAGIKVFLSLPEDAVREGSHYRNLVAALLRHVIKTTSQEHELHIWSTRDLPLNEQELARVKWRALAHGGEDLHPAWFQTVQECQLAVCFMCPSYLTSAGRNGCIDELQFFRLRQANGRGAPPLIVAPTPLQQTLHEEWGVAMQRWDASRQATESRRGWGTVPYVGPRGIPTIQVFVDPNDCGSLASLAFQRAYASSLGRVDPSDPPARVDSCDSALDGILKADCAIAVGPFSEYSRVDHDLRGRLFAQAKQVAVHCNVALGGGDSATRLLAQVIAERTGFGTERTVQEIVGASVGSSATESVSSLQASIARAILAINNVLSLCGNFPDHVGSGILVARLPEHLGLMRILDRRALRRALVEMAADLCGVAESAALDTLCTDQSIGAGRTLRLWTYRFLNTVFPKGHWPLKDKPEPSQRLVEFGVSSKFDLLPEDVVPGPGLVPRLAPIVLSDLLWHSLLLSVRIAPSSTYPCPVLRLHMRDKGSAWTTDAMLTDAVQHGGGNGLCLTRACHLWHLNGQPESRVDTVVADVVRRQAIELGKRTKELVLPELPILLLSDIAPDVESILNADGVPKAHTLYLVKAEAKALTYNWLLHSPGNASHNWLLVDKADALPEGILAGPIIIRLSGHAGRQLPQSVSGSEVMAGQMLDPVTIRNIRTRPWGISPYAAFEMSDVSLPPFIASALTQTYTRGIVMVGFRYPEEIADSIPLHLCRKVSGTGHSPIHLCLVGKWQGADTASVAHAFGLWNVNAVLKAPSDFLGDLTSGLRSRGGARP